MSEPSDPAPGGADRPRAPGWWQASDGRWYSPELQPGYAPPGYGAPTQGPARTSNGGAVTALVLGLLGLVMCGVFAGIPAIIVGGRARREIDESAGRQEGRGMATAGIVLGWVSVAFAALAAVGFLLVVVLASSTN